MPQRKPPFLSSIVMRRAFQARLLSVEPRASRIVGVDVRRIGGFENKSYKLRYRLTLVLRSGQRRQIILRGSMEGQDQTRRQAYVIMRYLWLHGFSAGPWQIVRPVTFFQRWKLLIYEEGRGTNLLALLRRPGVEAADYLERAARWLAELHRHSPRTIKSAYDQAGRKHYWLMALQVLSAAGIKELPALRQNITRVMRLEDTLARGRRRVLVHHDFHLANVLMLPKVVRVVDFTESRLSSPIIDVATFIIQLELQLGSVVKLDTIVRWQKVFLRAYRRSAPTIRLNTPSAQRIMRFVRFRIALQSFVAAYLFGRPGTWLKQAALDTRWYHG